MKKKKLSECRPELFKQIHPTKNPGLDLDNLSPKSKQEVVWICEKGHEWSEKICNRVRRTSIYCEVCISLAATHPHLVEEWNFEKNGELGLITSGSSRKFCWKCPNGHDYKASIRSRARGSGCPYCSQDIVARDLSIITTHSKLSKQYDQIKNKIPLERVVSNSRYEAWWRCEKGHEWLERVCNRARHKDVSCKICKSLGCCKPELIEEWDPSNPFSPFDVSANSSESVVWKCKICGHKWEAIVANRFRGSGCPGCSGLAVTPTSSLEYCYPEIAKEWDCEANQKKPVDYTTGTEEIVHWICPNGHKYKESIYNRTKRDRGCKYCRSLAYLYPDIVKELLPYDNIIPETEYAGSPKKVRWQCSSCERIWQARIADRCRGTGCPVCNSGWTVDNIRLFVKSILPYIGSFTSVGLYSLLQQAGLYKIGKHSKGKTFIQALKTGKIPKEELEKFIDQRPSLVDKFLADKDFSLEDNLLVDENCLSEMALSEDDDILPIVQTQDILTSLDSKIVSSADEETVNFFIKESVARIWQHAFINVQEALEQLKQYNKNGLYPEMVKCLFMEEYNGTIGLSIPAGYAFEYQPNLMQLYTAYLIKSRKRIGNWSGTGAGKTLSAILASRVIGARLTVICCPNNVIDNWKEKLSKIYPNSSICLTIKDLERQYSAEVPQYLILNYEFFQHDKNQGIRTEEILEKILTKYNIDFIIIDEIHFSKQREVNQCSIRKQVISSFVAAAGNKNSNLHVLGMSATPVINNLHEGKTLIELITGLQYDDLDTQPTVSNCVSLYKMFVSHGIRWIPRYDCTISVNIKEIDCKDYIEVIKQKCSTGSLVGLEAILTKAKLPFILENLSPKTVIYTHYIKGILPILQEAIQQNGWKVAIFTGEFKDRLKDFIKGDADILIASSCVGTGVDGLQYVSHKMIINSLPWTHAEFEQLKGRVYRQGQSNPDVEILVPLTYANINGEKWSWCDSRWKRIQFKKSIADAAVDGVIPEGYLRTPAQAYKDTMEWLKRLEAGEVNTIERKKIGSTVFVAEHSEGIHRIDYFSKMNSLINHQTSQQTQELFLRDPKSWHEYHAAFSEARKGWDVVPCQEAKKWCQLRPDSVIGDFGCGEAFLARELKNKVYSFDHVAINDKVIACDMSHVPLENGSLDAAIFSLSLMGENYIDYLKEARRCLKLDGQLWIAEPTSRIIDLAMFKEMLERLGFFVINTNEMWKFTFIYAIKNTQEINDIALTELLKNKKILS